MHITHGEMVEVICLSCGNKFKTAKRYLHLGKGKYCSRSCTAMAGGYAGKIWNRLTEKGANSKLAKEARKELYKAIKQGEVVKQPCEICGSAKVGGHHDDYAKPLDVRWFCKKHHAQHHLQVRKGG